MRPKFQVLERGLVRRILHEAYELLREPGVRVGSEEAKELLSAAGAWVEGEVAQIPEKLARTALASAPKEFWLYARGGERAVHYGGNDVHFDPGSCCLKILDPERGARLAESADLVRLIQVAEMLPQYAAQATAMVCHDVADEIGDLYRLFLVLLYSKKPVVTGAFSAKGLAPMLELLAVESGGSEAMRAKPRAVFDVCPSPPLNWSEFAAQNLVELARAGVPAEIVSMPLAGATAPVTLAGAVTQHAAECLAGITIHQLARRGAPIVWGGAPAIFDMRVGTAPMGAIETVMLNLACCEVGKSLGLPTHGYMVATDGRSVDAQAGMESGTSAALGALSGINMISGAGMLELLACHSIEKLVLDAEAIASAQRLVEGIPTRSDTLATGSFAEAGLGGNFLALPETRALFRQVQHFPSNVIERGGEATAGDAYARARARVEELAASYQRPEIDEKVEREMVAFMEARAHAVGMSQLPGVESAVSHLAS